MITGIHHVTAIASDPQRNVDFYSGLLGLRLVKTTVNFDDPSAYHLYYGDAAGTPGSIVTFFYWPEFGARGRVGSGQMSAISFSAAPAALPFWRARLTQAGFDVEEQQRHGERLLGFADPDGIPLEIVGVADDARVGWTAAGINADVALRGLHTAPLTVRSAAPTEELLTRVMGYRLVWRAAHRARFEIGPGGSGRSIDVIEDASVPAGTGGVGTIHHIAWRVADDAGERALQQQLRAAGFHVSEVRDRSYFRSIYYRERNGILFEIATDVPGFGIDESSAELGTSLRLPAMYESRRAWIEQALPPLRRSEGWNRVSSAPAHHDPTLHVGRTRAAG